METTSHVHTTNMESLMTLSNTKLEAWFEAGGLSVRVVANCSDSNCPNCFTLEPAQEAA